MLCISRGTYWWSTCLVELHLRRSRVVLKVDLIFLIALVRNVAAFSTAAVVVGIGTLRVFVGSLLCGITVLDGCIVKERREGLH